MFSAVVERRCGVKNGLLCKVEDLAHVERNTGGALYAGLDFLELGHDGCQLIFECSIGNIS